MSITPCPSSTPVTTGIVVFDPTVFKVAFPSFATVADASLSFAFDLATLQLNNSCGSRVCDATLREKLLNLLTAHIAALAYGENGNPPAGIVGAITKAQEGSVSVGTDVGTIVYGQAYYLQTQWGFMYWQATARFRTMVYIPAPPVCADFGGLGGGLLPPGNGGCGC